MKYYFCIDIPWENTYIETYDNLEELKKENKRYMKNNNNWYIIKGEEIEDGEKWKELKTQ